MELYVREKYLRKMRGFYHDTEVIKVITGVRRCGKSCLMKTVMDELRRKGISEEHLISFDLDSLQYRKVKTADRLEELILSQSHAEGVKYLFIDEIQNVAGFEEVVNAFREDGNYSIFITGSNSYLLSGELVTKLTGRYIEFEMFPLTFDEYLDMKAFYGKPVIANLIAELNSYLNVELRLLPLLAHMDTTGVIVDNTALQHNKMVIDPILKDLEQKAEVLIGHPILMWSSKQVCEVLYDELKLEAPKGNRVSTESVLQTMADKHPFPGLVIEYRRLSKQMSTYIDGLEKEFVSVPFRPTETKQIYSTWNQMATGTGRLSTAAPNMQTLPKRSLGRLKNLDVDIRGAFVALPNRRLISVDYRQIEMRVFAHCSHDIALINLFSSGQNSDIYTLIASMIHKVEVKDVTQQFRDEAKVITLGLCYGMGVESMASKLKIPILTATQLKNSILNVGLRELDGKE